MREDRESARPSSWTDVEARTYATKMLKATPWGRRVIHLLEDLQRDRDEVEHLRGEVERMKGEVSKALADKFRAEGRMLRAMDVDHVGSVCSTCGLIAPGAAALTCECNS